MDNIKQAIVVRKDLKMRRGKEAAQVAHASMLFLLDYLESLQNARPPQEGDGAFFTEVFTKVVLRARDEEELNQLLKEAHSRDMFAYGMYDTGPEFDGETLTAIAIGPDTFERVDAVTGHLDPV